LNVSDSRNRAAGQEQNARQTTGTATAGLREVAEWEVDLELLTESAEQYWQMLSEHVSLAATALAQVDDAARERIRARVVTEVSAFERDGAIRVPGVARCTSART
jgi:hypothetical protein